MNKIESQNLLTGMSNEVVVGRQNPYFQNSKKYIGFLCRIDECENTEKCGLGRCTLLQNRTKSFKWVGNCTAASATESFNSRISEAIF